MATSSFLFEEFPRTKWEKTIAPAICVKILLFVAIATSPCVGAVPPEQAKAQCRKKLERIAYALHTYRSFHGCLPPAHIVDQDGRRMHSWRVLLANFIESTRVYDHYDLDEPWNGVKNRALLREFYIKEHGEVFDITSVRDCYRCPGAPASQSTFDTNYVMIVDDRQPLVPVPGRNRTFADRGWKARRYAGGEIMIVEVLNSGIHWLEPRDLSVDQVSDIINDSTKPSISSPHVGGAFVILADGTVQFLDQKNTKQKLHGMLRKRLGKKHEQRQNGSVKPNGERGTSAKQSGEKRQGGR